MNKWRDMHDYIQSSGAEPTCLDDYWPDNYYWDDMWGDPLGSWSRIGTIIVAIQRGHKKRWVS